MEMVADLWWFWFFTRFWKEADAWIQGALSLPEVRTPGRARSRLLLAAGALATLQARVAEGREFLEEAGPMAEAAGDDYTGSHGPELPGPELRSSSLDSRGKDHAARALAWFAGASGRIRASTLAPHECARGRGRGRPGPSGPPECRGRPGGPEVRARRPGSHPPELVSPLGVAGRPWEGGAPRPGLYFRTQERALVHVPGPGVRLHGRGRGDPCA
jgi:hypothetical protein